MFQELSIFWICLILALRDVLFLIIFREVAWFLLNIFNRLLYVNSARRLNSIDIIIFNRNALQTSSKSLTKYKKSYKNNNNNKKNIKRKQKKLKICI